MNLPTTTTSLLNKAPAPPKRPATPTPDADAGADATANATAVVVDDLGGSGGMRNGLGRPDIPTHAVFHPFSRYGDVRADFKGGTQRWSKCCKTKTSYFCVDCGFDFPICNKDACQRLHTQAPAYKYDGPRNFRRQT